MSRRYSKRFRGVFYAPTTTPKDCLPHALNPKYDDDNPRNQNCHTDIQVQWRRHIMGKIMKQREEMYLAYCIGWSYGTNSKYAPMWKEEDRPKGIERGKMGWKPEEPQLSP